MSRYLGPRVKKMRALGVNLPGLSAKSIERRPHPPGQHGANRRGKLSNYALQLREKQKLRLNYGVSERQLRRLVKEARASKMASGEKLVELLERRLDNVVFRAGFANTIPSARQLINHRHLRVNGRRVDIASFRVKPGDIIEFRPKSQKLESVTESLQTGGQYRAEWMQVDTTRRMVTITEIPTVESLLFPLDLQFVIEYYSRLL